MFELRSERNSWGSAHAESQTSWIAPLEEVHLAAIAGTRKGSKRALYHPPDYWTRRYGLHLPG